MPPDPSTYAWNPLWADPVDSGNPEYTNAVRRMIIASIRFLAKHPDAPMEWREPSQESLARMAGVPVDASIVVAAAWEDVYEPRNVWTRRWFQTMSNACGRGKKAPSAFMMSKSIACGMLFKQAGWEAFDRFMLETPGPATPH